MPYIRVIYTHKECPFDYVSGDLLASLILHEKISHFLRPSENKWINVKLDLIRGSGGTYDGPDRRNWGHSGQDPVKMAKPKSLDWLENLSAKIEK